MSLIKKDMIITLRVPVDFTPSEGVYKDFSTLEECMDIDKENVMDDPTPYVSDAVALGEVTITFEDHFEV